MRGPAHITAPDGAPAASQRPLAAPRHLPRRSRPLEGTAFRAQPASRLGYRSGPRLAVHPRTDTRQSLPKSLGEHASAALVPTARGSRGSSRHAPLRALPGGPEREHRARLQTRPSRIGSSTLAELCYFDALETSEWPVRQAIAVTSGFGTPSSAGARSVSCQLVPPRRSRDQADTAGAARRHHITARAPHARIVATSSWCAAVTGTPRLASTCSPRARRASAAPLLPCSINSSAPRR